MSAERLAEVRARLGCVPVIVAGHEACGLLAELDAVTAEREALHAALLALTADVEEHIADVTCENGALRRVIAPARTRTCAQPTEAYGALAGPCPGCVERSKVPT